MIIADFGSYTVEDTRENVLNRRRELKRMKRKEDREETVSAYVAGFCTLGMICLFIILHIFL